MNNIRPYIIPCSIIVITTVGSASLDILTSQKIADFRLAPGFGRRVEIVKTSELKKESSSYWGCPSPNNLNSDNIYFNQEHRYTLYLEKDFDTSSINITVESKSGNTDTGTDPVIIIKPLDKDLEQKCQDKLDRQYENLNPEESEEEVNTGTLKPVPLKLTQKGTYLMWIANEYDTKDKGTYSIEIVEERISAK